MEREPGLLRSIASKVLIIALGATVGSFATFIFLNNGIDIQDIVLLIVGALVGIIPTYFLLYRQFWDGYAGYRMKTIIDATFYAVSEFKKPPEQRKTAVLRNKYRYGLGVFIDELEQMNSKGLKPDDIYPTLIGEIDRWDRFNFYVRPVIDEINAYTLLRTASSCSRRITQIGKLADLCNQLEVVVMILDAAFDDTPQIVDWKEIKGSKHLVLAVQSTDSRVKELTDALETLFKRWGDWKEAIGANSSVAR